MSKNLYIFGCSYSSEFINSGIPDSYLNYKGYWPKTWTKYLSEKLNYNLINYAKGGNSNNQIFEDFCSCSDILKEDDIVIIEWSYMTRYRWVNFNSNEWSNHVTLDGKKIDNKIDDAILLNRTHFLYKQEVLNWQKIIEILSKKIKFNLYIWDGSYDFLYKESYENRNDRKFICSELIPQGRTFIDMIFINGGNRILEETMGKINDIHLGEKGHEIQGELFYQHIKKDLNL